MAITYEAIATTTVGAGGASSIDFTSIPGTYTDLVVLVSARGSSYDGSSTNQLFLRFNNNSSSYSTRSLSAATSSVVSGTNPYGVTSAIWCGEIPSINQTASTFGNTFIYIPNYTSSNNKSLSVDNVSETNGASDYTYSLSLGAGLWSNTSVIDRITLYCKFTLDGTFQQYTTATLYGIKNTV